MIYHASISKPVAIPVGEGDPRVPLYELQLGIEYPSQLRIFILRSIDVVTQATHLIMEVTIIFLLCSYACTGTLYLYMYM